MRVCVKCLFMTSMHVNVGLVFLLEEGEEEKEMKDTEKRRRKKNKHTERLYFVRQTVMGRKM